MGPIWDAELRVWDAKNFGLVSPGTHRNKFVKKSLNNVKIDQDQLQLIMKHILFYEGWGHFAAILVK